MSYHLSLLGCAGRSSCWRFMLASRPIIDQSIRSQLQAQRLAGGVAGPRPRHGGRAIGPAPWKPTSPIDSGPAHDVAGPVHLRRIQRRITSGPGRRLGGIAGGARGGLCAMSPGNTASSAARAAASASTLLCSPPPWCRGPARAGIERHEEATPGAAQRPVRLKQRPAWNCCIECGDRHALSPRSRTR